MSPRLFLGWVAALAGTSWSGMALAEIGAFGAVTPVVVGLVAGFAVYLYVGRQDAGTSGMTLPTLAAAAALVTLVPTIDTTLLSQDASVHRASGIWLARAGSLEIPDERLAVFDDGERLGLFGGSTLTPVRLSTRRLPGGIVAPSLEVDAAYPSFSHLLAVWIGIAWGLAGTFGVALLGPLFAFTAWWAVGWVGWLDGGRRAGVAAVALLALWLPEHWFARFLMPEIIGQALVWSAVVAARFAMPSSGGRPLLEGGGRRVAGVLCGVLLGVAAFARLEQFWIFVPALLVVRAIIEPERRILPAGAALAFAIVGVHAALHLAIIPTDYGNRIFKVPQAAFTAFVVFVSALSGDNGYVTAFLLQWVIPPLLLGGLVGLGWYCRRLESRSAGTGVRLVSAIVAVIWLALIYARGWPDAFPAVRALGFYVPVAVWGAVVAGLGTLVTLPALEIAMLVQVLDQLVNARVTDEQIWASRRLVTVVLPMVALLAARATAVRGGRGRSSLAALLVVVAIGMGAWQLRTVAFRPIQSGASAFVEEVAAAVPDDAMVILAGPLDWLHIAPALWLGHDRWPMVAREHELFPPAFERFLEEYPDDLWLLTGAVVPEGGQIDTDRGLPQLPGYERRVERRFTWGVEMLERTRDRPPSALVPYRAGVVLERLVPRR